MLKIIKPVVSIGVTEQNALSLIEDSQVKGSRYWLNHWKRMRQHDIVGHRRADFVDGVEYMLYSPQNGLRLFRTYSPETGKATSEKYYLNDPYACLFYPFAYSWRKPDFKIWRFEGNGSVEFSIDTPYHFPILKHPHVTKEDCKVYLFGRKAVLQDIRNWRNPWMYGRVIGMKIKEATKVADVVMTKIQPK